MKLGFPCVVRMKVDNSVRTVAVAAVGSASLSRAHKYLYGRLRQDKSMTRMRERETEPARSGETRVTGNCTYYTRAVLSSLIATVRHQER